MRIAIHQRQPDNSRPVGGAEHLSLGATPSTGPPDPEAHAPAQRDRGMEQHAENRLAAVFSTYSLINI